jgi:hypothetical protein
MITDKTQTKLTIYETSKIRFKKLKPYIIIKYGCEDSDVAVFDKILDIIEESLENESTTRAQKEKIQ